MTYYDRQGNRISANEFSRLRTEEYLRVGSTKVGEHINVSTVWLGIDHAFGDDQKPVIFETMLFSDGPLNNECERYSTEEEARAGHERMVARACEAEAGRLHPEPSDVAGAVSQILREHFGHVPASVLEAASYRSVQAVIDWQRSLVMSP